MIENKLKRPAIAMIELIFAIVIMGIVLMSAPTLISSASKSVYVTIIQEAINEAASHANLIMGYHWDENTADELYLDPILSVTSGSSDLDADVNSSRRKGTPQESYRSFVRSDGSVFGASTVFVDATDTEKDDVDDFIGGAILINEQEAGLIDNIEQGTIDIDTTVSYSSDNVSGTGGYNQSSITYNPFSASGGTTNIKTITVTLTSSSDEDELDKSIELRAFSCNIGGYKLAERDL